jgi:hypothetical protein
VSIRDELLAAGFRQAGAIRPNRAGGCDYSSSFDVTGCVVYAHVVGEIVKKFGTTAPSLCARVSQNVSTINQVIVLQEGRARDAAWHHWPFDAFKRLAPEVTKAGQTIEVWAIESSVADYKTLERYLNAKYNTIGNGWGHKAWLRSLSASLSCRRCLYSVMCVSDTVTRVGLLLAAFEPRVIPVEDDGVPLLLHPCEGEFL